MNRCVKIAIILFITTLLIFGSISCGKKGPPVPVNPFSNDALDK